MRTIMSENFYVVINDKNICIGRVTEQSGNYSISRHSKELYVFHDRIVYFEDMLKYSSEYLQGARSADSKITHDLFVIESHDNVAATLFIGPTIACTKLEPFALSPALAVHETSEIRDLLNLLRDVKKLVL